MTNDARIHQGTVDLEFADESTAKAFPPKLAKIMDTPQAKDHVLRHVRPRLLTVVTDAIPANLINDGP